MALVSRGVKPSCSSAIEASLFLLFHTSELSERFQGTLHVGKIVQTVTIEKMSQVNYVLCTYSTCNMLFLRMHIGISLILVYVSDVRAVVFFCAYILLFCVHVCFFSNLHFYAKWQIEKK